MQSCETDAEPSHLKPRFSITIMGDHDRNENFVFFRKFLFTFHVVPFKSNAFFAASPSTALLHVSSDLSSVPK